MEEDRNQPDEEEGPPTEVSIRSMYFDTPAIYASPELLRQKVDGITLIVPDLVVQELQLGAVRSRRAAQTLTAVREAEKQGLISIRAIQPRPRVRFPGLSPNDAALLSHVYQASAQGAVLVTNDQQLLLAAKQVSIVALDSGGALAWLTLFAIPFASSPALNESIDKLQIYILLGGVLGAGLALALALLVVIFGPVALRWVADHLGPLAFLSAFPVGLLLYVFRANAQSAYGVFEISFGMAAAMAGVDAIRVSPVTGFNGVMAIGAGLYVIVRGLDNLEKGSKSSPFLRAAFRVVGVR